MYLSIYFFLSFFNDYRLYTYFKCAFPNVLPFLLLNWLCLEIGYNPIAASMSKADNQMSYPSFSHPPPFFEQYSHPRKYEVSIATGLSLPFSLLRSTFVPCAHQKSPKLHPIGSALATPKSPSFSKPSLARFWRWEGSN